MPRHHTFYRHLSMSCRHCSLVVDDIIISIPSHSNNVANPHMGELVELQALLGTTGMTDREILNIVAPPMAERQRAHLLDKVASLEASYTETAITVRMSQYERQAASSSYFLPIRAPTLLSYCRCN
jgi:hypothetical protein